jgi:hypothetical protein
MIGLPNDQSTERNKKLDLEIRKIEFNPFFIDASERIYLPSGVYLHQGSSTYHGPEDAHAAVAGAARIIEPGAFAIVFQKSQAIYSGSGGQEANGWSACGGLHGSRMRSGLKHTA